MKQIKPSRSYIQTCSKVSIADKVRYLNFVLQVKDFALTFV